MDRIRRLIREAHRRSLWQVLGVYLVGSWGALEAVGGLTESAGLPDWVPPFALVLLIVGLPVVVATAVVQEGAPGAERDDAAGDGAADAEPGDGPGSPEPDRPGPPPNLAAGTGSLDLPSTRPPAYHRLLTWRNAILGGVGAFALLGLAVAGYFTMRVLGVGPVASLVAQGVLDEGEEIVLARFANSTSDPALGGAVTEALRIDLVESPVLSVLAPDAVEGALRRMEREPSSVLTAELAREVAVREGLKAVLDGEVSALGSGYVFTATLRASETARPLAAFRETAEGEDEVIDALDKLSQRIREKAGESLRSIKGGRPLAEVTTSSLEALRKYAEADEAFDRGDTEEVRALLEDAIELDPDFAMAHRKLAVVHNNTGMDHAGLVEAATRAYELRDRLTERERHLAEAFYHSSVTGEYDEVVRAYRSVLRLDPDDPVALNNLAGALAGRERFSEAVELLERAVSGPAESSVTYFNLVIYLAVDGRPEEALQAAERWRRRYPEDPSIPLVASLPRTLSGDVEGALGRVAELRSDPGAPAFARIRAHGVGALIEARRGRLREARRLLQEAVSLARSAGGPAVELERTLLLALMEVRSGVAPEEGLRRARALAEEGALDGVPVHARPYDLLVETLAVGGDADAARAALDRWRRSLPPDRDGLARGGVPRAAAEAFLEGRIALARGDAEGAVVAIEEARSLGGCRRCWRYDLARALEAAGETRAAAAAYLEAGREIVPVPFPLYMNPFAYERAGILFGELGDSARAAEAYGAFAELWSDPDPELRPRVERARAWTAALSES